MSGCLKGGVHYVRRERVQKGNTRNIKDKQLFYNFAKRVPLNISKQVLAITSTAQAPILVGIPFFRSYDAIQPGMVHEDVF